MDTAASPEIPVWLWYAFGGTVLLMMGIDFLTYRGDLTGGSKKKHLMWSVAWITVSLLFGVLLWFILDRKLAMEYFASYAMEKGLSLDNLFLFYVIFQGLSVPKKHQHRVLFWGIIGAVVFRGIFIFLGIQALEKWEWITYVFAAILLYAGWKSFKEDPQDQEESRLLEWLSNRLPINKEGKGDEFVLLSGDKWAVTPLLVALVAIELTDVMFAIDSVPAALSITHNKFLVYSSNIFAILGLRALYLYAVEQIQNLRHLHYGLAAVLVFAAAKILTQQIFEVPPLASVGVVVALIGISVIASLKAESPEQEPGISKS